MRTKKAIINIISSLILQIVTIICGLIIPKLIITTYGSKINGLVTSITQFLAYITLIEAGFGPVIKSVLFKPIANNEKSEIEKILKASERIFKIISFIFIGYIILLCIILPLVLKREFDGLFTFSLIIIISMSTFAEYYFGMTYKIFLQANQSTHVVAVIQLSTYILNTMALILLIRLGASIQVIKLTSTFIFVLRPVLQNIYVKKKYKINLKNVNDNYNIKQKWEGLAQHIAYVVYNNADIAILTLCGKIIDISVYSIYSLIVSNITKVIKSFNSGVDATFGDMIAKGEKEKLNKCFKIYEGIYINVASIVFCSTLFLIIPFVKLYTQGITDANYTRPVFAYLIVITEFIFIIRQPYNDLVKVAGHFKQTKKGAYIESILNIVISLALVWNFGLVGVTIGTLAAMPIRTIEIIYYASKYILNRNVWYSFKRMTIIILEFLIITFVINFLPYIEINGYREWIVQAIIITFISAIIVVSANSIIYKENVKNIINRVKRKET